MPSYTIQPKNTSYYDFLITYSSGNLVATNDYMGGEISWMVYSGRVCQGFWQLHPLFCQLKNESIYRNAFLKA